MKKNKKTVLLPALAALFAAGAGLSGCGQETEVLLKAAPNEGEDVKSRETLTILVNVDTAGTGYEEFLRDAEEELGIDIELEYKVGNEEGENLVRGRLASGEMADICSFNSGCLLATVYPEEYFLDLSDQKYIEQIDERFLNAVTIDGAVYGVPESIYSGAGVVLYNKELYEKYHLEIPETWDDFLKNCEILKASGETAVIGAFAEDWTNQICLLADYYNVQAEIPDFAEKFEKGEIRYATSPIALRSWEKCSDLVPYYNEDFMEMTSREGCHMLMEGEGAHYIFMTDMALNYIYMEYGEQADRLGAFGMPGEDGGNRGITVWLPNGLFVNKYSEHQETALRFLEYYMSEEGIRSYMTHMPPSGPLIVKGISLPEDVNPVVKQMQEYMDSGNYCAALEYQTTLKGKNCSKIITYINQGRMDAETAAAAYDRECEKAAEIMGLEWDYYGS